MFRHNQSLRLTSMDAVLFARVAGTDSPPPITVGDYNRRLAAAALRWGGGPSAGESLLANMALDMMLDPLDPTDVLSGGPLVKTFRRDAG